VLSALHVVGPLWEPDGERPTPLGRLVRAAKDEGEAEAAAELGRRVAQVASGIELPAGTLVVAVPPGPDRSPHPAPALAAAVAAGTGLTRSEAVIRRHPTAPLRSLAPVERAGAVAEAGYEVVAPVNGRTVLLVDDVVLTGTTLVHLAGLLTAAGARRVEALVACRTRRAG
jgi:predicted amidophosphoribosyltransferase